MTPTEQAIKELEQRAGFGQEPQFELERRHAERRVQELTDTRHRVAQGVSVALRLERERREQVRRQGDQNKESVLRNQLVSVL